MAFWTFNLLFNCLQKAARIIFTSQLTSALPSKNREKAAKTHCLFLTSRITLSLLPKRQSFTAMHPPHLHQPSGDHVKTTKISWFRTTPSATSWQIALPQGYRPQTCSRHLRRQVNYISKPKVKSVLRRKLPKATQQRRLAEPKSSPIGPIRRSRKVSFW